MLKKILPLYSSLPVQNLHGSLLNICPFILTRSFNSSWSKDCVLLLELIEPDYWSGNNEMKTNYEKNKYHFAMHLPQLKSLQSVQAKAGYFSLSKWEDAPSVDQDDSEKFVS